MPIWARIIISLTIGCCSIFFGQNVPPPAVTNTWSVVQHKFNDGGCSSTATCATTVTSTGAGHTLVLMVATTSASTSADFSSASGGGTWTKCSTCSANVTGASFDSVFMAYTLNSSSGATSISVTANHSQTSWAIEIVELSWSGSTMTFDAGGSGTDATCTSCAGQALTLTGTQDTILQLINGDHSFSAISGGAGYTTFKDFTSVADGAFAGQINTTNGAAPTWTANTTSKQAVAAIAIAGS